MPSSSTGAATLSAIASGTVHLLGQRADGRPDPHQASLGQPEQGQLAAGGPHRLPQHGLQRPLVGAGEHQLGGLGRDRLPALAPFGVLIQAGVLDGDAGRGGQRHHQLLVLLAELAVAGLGQVEVAEHLVPDPDRHAEEAAHRRVAGRETDRGRVLAEVCDPDRFGMADQVTQQAAPDRQRPDRRDRGRGHPGVHELFQHPVPAHHPESGIAGIHQLPGGADDVPQYQGQAQVRGDQGIGA